MLGGEGHGAPSTNNFTGARNQQHGAQRQPFSLRPHDSKSYRGVRFVKSFLGFGFRDSGGPVVVLLMLLKWVNARFIRPKPSSKVLFRLYLLPPSSLNSSQTE